MLGLSGSLLRGIGVGLILAGVILSLGDFDPSREEIMAKAKQYGMLTEEEFLKKQQEAKPVEDNKSSEKPQQEHKAQPEPGTQVEPEPQPEPKPQVEPEPQSEPKPQVEPEPSQGEKPRVSTEIIEVNIPRGSNSSEIAQILLDKKIITSVDEFLNQVHKMRAAKRFKAGRFDLKLGLTYEEIIIALTK